MARPYQVALSILSRYQVTTVRFRPYFIRQLLNYPGIKDADLSSVRLVLSSGSYFSPKLIAKLAVAIPHKFNFGQSESCLCFCIYCLHTESQPPFSLWDVWISEFDPWWRCVCVCWSIDQVRNNNPASPTYQPRWKKLRCPSKFSWDAFTRRRSAYPQRRWIRSRCQWGWRIVCPKQMCRLGLLEQRESNARSIRRWLGTQWRFSSSGPEWLVFVSQLGFLRLINCTLFIYLLQHCRQG